MRTANKKDTEEKRKRTRTEEKTWTKRCQRGRQPPATQASLCHLPSSCPSGFLTCYVTAAVTDRPAACIDLTQRYTDAGKSIGLKASAGRGQRELEAETPTLTNMRKKRVFFYSFISTQKKHRPAFSQNVWNFTSEPDLSCT